MTTTGTNTCAAQLTEKANNTHTIPAARFLTISPPWKDHLSPPQNLSFTIIGCNFVLPSIRQGVANDIIGSH
ncbi:MAG: hypothetical protein ACRD2L_24590, partial [Terriglobia bacterium]